MNINCSIYKNYDAAYRAIKTDLDKYDSENVNIINKDSKFYSAELINDDYPWMPKSYMVFVQKGSY